MNYILDKDHNPILCINPIEWIEFFKKAANRIVKKTVIGDTEVSTVFLGIDYNFTHIGLPILFETMCFGPLDPHNDIQDRYRTWDEALKEHEVVCQLLRNWNEALQKLKLKEGL